VVCDGSNVEYGVALLQTVSIHMPKNCENISLTFESQLSKSKVARVRP
jgi:hypothetical protein